eukprot:2351958-Pleurochrysis_carterae.AAC.1
MPLALSTDRERERMRASAACAWRRLWFSSIYGNCLGESGGDDAFDGLMLTLAMRVGRGRAAHERSLHQCLRRHAE